MMTTQERKLLDRLVAEVQAMKRQMAQIPSRWALPPSLSYIRVQGGNTLTDGQVGIKKILTAITDVPTAYTPGSGAPYIDGVGFGTLFSDGVSQGSVIVLNDSASGVDVAVVGIYNSGEYSGDLCTVTATVSLTVGGDPNTAVTAYRIGFL